MPTTFRLPVTRRSMALLAVAFAITACSSVANPASSGSTGSPVPSVPPGSPAASPSTGSTTVEIEHLTGAPDVILRVEQGGGFVPIDFLASQAPSFTLYGNGVVVFQQTLLTFPEPDGSGVIRTAPWRTAKLDEGQIQELLAFAVGPGGLGAARDQYVANGVADAPDTIFTLRAGGVDKKVVVNALSEETQAGPDSVARAAFSKLAKRLMDFDAGGTIPSDVYVADRYRGVLTAREPQPGLISVAWPWAALEPVDFKEGPSDGSAGPTLPHRTMTADEVAALKLDEIEGGLQGLVLKGPDGKFYGFILRPLLADEKE